MANRGFASMQIGGVIQRDVLDELRELLLVEGVTDENTNETVAARTPEDLLALACGGLLSFFDLDARGGIFEDIETFCVERQIAFTRYSGCLYEYSPELVQFRPGLSEPVSMAANSYLEALVLAHEVHAAMVLLEKGDVSGAQATLRAYGFLPRRTPG